MSQLNPLYPIFLKVDQNPILIVGGGSVAAEKLHFILKNSPNANIHLKAKVIGQEVLNIIQSGVSRLTYELGEFTNEDVNKGSLIISAANCTNTNNKILAAAHAQNKLVNIADTPDLCDFYLGSIVSRGPLKIAISTNGLSPTFAKRIRQWLEQELPIETEELITKLNTIRNRVKGGFKERVNALNKITSSLIESI